MGFEHTTLGLGIRLAVFLHVPPSGEKCCPVRVLAAMPVASASPIPPSSDGRICSMFAAAGLQDTLDSPFVAGGSLALMES